MKNVLHGRNQYEKENSQNTEQFRALFNKIDESIRSINEAVVNKRAIPEKEIGYLKQLGIKSTVRDRQNKNFFVNFKLKEQDFHDLGVLATTFGYQEVKQHIGYIYENYTVLFKMDCIGALLRVILKTEHMNDSCSAF